MYITPQTSTQAATRTGTAVATGTGTTSQNLFSITGAGIIMRALYCTVTTAFAGAATSTLTIRPGITPTGMAGGWLSAASPTNNVNAGIALGQTGCVYTSLFTPLTGGGTALANYPVTSESSLFLLPNGIISATYVVGGAAMSSGALSWTVVYDSISGGGAVAL